ncbi:unnamed protein product, partial [Hapterophycus canaliculatus]
MFRHRFRPCALRGYLAGAIAPPTRLGFLVDGKKKREHEKRPPKRRRFPFTRQGSVESQRSESSGAASDSHLIGLVEGRIEVQQILGGNSWRGQGAACGGVVRFVRKTMRRYSWKFQWLL